MKNKLFNLMLEEMETCQKCINLRNKSGRDCSLVNIYNNLTFSKNIPSIWTDWFNRLNSEIMIIGQDWGPYLDMKTLHQLYMQNPTKSNWKNLLDYYIKESSNSLYSLTDIFITNAIMCARTGTKYRGDNIDLKKSTDNCSEYLKKQVEVVKPKVILTLGYYPLYSLSKSYNFIINKTLKETIANYPEIKINDFTIIPLYHPVAQIKKTEQLKQYKRIWKYV